MVSFSGNLSLCYRCSYRCSYSAHTPLEVIHHDISSHSLDQTFSIKMKTFDEKSGIVTIQSAHFQTRISELNTYINNGYRIIVNAHERKIRVKRPSDVQSGGQQSDQKHEVVQKHEKSNYEDKIHSQTETEHSDIYQLLSGVISQLQDMERLGDFKALLHAIQAGHLRDDIAFHLLLDVGKFYDQSCIKRMRYDQQTIEFWLTVSKLFKGRGKHFFRSYKGESIGHIDQSHQLCVK